MTICQTRATARKNSLSLSSKTTKCRVQSLNFTNLSEMVKDLRFRRSLRRRYRSLYSPYRFRTPKIENKNTQQSHPQLLVYYDLNISQKVHNW